MSLLAADAPLRKAAATNRAETSAFASALSRSLGLDAQLASQAPLIEAALDGLELRLLQGAPPEETEEAYHRFWVSALA
jgi:hypothetical protein